jgi:uncharacterized protein (TIGR03066 family)
MRNLLAAVLFFGLGGYLAAADDKLDEKFLIGKWTIKTVGAKADAKVEKSIEFKPKGLYAMDDRGTKTEGTYKLKGTNIDLTEKSSGAVTTWKDVTIKDGKLNSPLRGGKAHLELTRVEEKKEEKKEKDK